MIVVLILPWVKELIICKFELTQIQPISNWVLIGANFVSSSWISFSSLNLF